MIDRDHQGRVRGTKRVIRSSMTAEILSAQDWQDTAYMELTRLLLEVGAYHTQLKDRVGYEETGAAVAALQAACDAFSEECGPEPSLWDVA